jgi:glyoxylase-like metal-dependent hydrolase (beta-lactamase superfamily II)
LWAPSPAAAADIHDAAQEGDLAAVQSILEANSSRINELDDSGDTPLHLAAFGGHLELAGWLVDNGADVLAVDYGGSYPLHYAAYGGNVEIVELFLQKGSPLDPSEAYGNTPLIYAAYMGHTEVVRLLHEKGANLHHANDSNQSSLYFVARLGDLDTVKLIVEDGGDVNLLDAYGRRPLFVAKNNNRDEVAEYLIQHGAKDDFRLGEPKVEALAQDVTLLRIPFANRISVGVLTVSGGVVLIDTGLQTAAPFLNEVLQKIGAANVTTIINTHLHGDHNGANALVDSTATVISFETLEQMETDGVLIKSDAGMTGPSGKSFAPHYSLRLGSTEVRIIPATGTHSEADVIVYLPASDVAFMGSLLISEGFPGVGSGAIDQYVEILDTAIDVFPADTRFVAGHGRPLDMKELKEYREMVTASIAAVKKAMEKDKSIDEMDRAGVLARWSTYGECPFLPYITTKIWINTIFYAGE